MNFLSKLDWLMARDGLNKHTLAQRSGVPYTTIVGLYERGPDNARLNTLNKLCAFFHVHLDYLVLDQYEKPEDFTPNGNTAYVICSSEREAEVVTIYRSLSDSEQKTVLTMLRGFSEGRNSKKETSSTETA